MLSEFFINTVKHSSLVLTTQMNTTSFEKPGSCVRQNALPLSLKFPQKFIKSLEVTNLLQ